MLKEQLYKTARITQQSPWPFGDEWAPGEYVAVEYFNHVYDGFTQSMQPVYHVTRDDREAYLFAASLDSFCL